MIVPVGTINDNLRDFAALGAIAAQIPPGPADVAFTFTDCGFLRPIAVAFLGAQATMIQDRGGHVEFAWDTMAAGVRRNLDQNGFSRIFGRARGPWTGNSLPYRHDRRQDHDKIIEYLQGHWLRPTWLHLSNRLLEAIIGNTWEIYANAFEHSSSPCGVFTCGTHYPKLRMVGLTVVDLGCGIPAKVEGFLKGRLSAAVAMKWACEPGTSTAAAATGFPRGLGLDLLKEFAKVNKGSLEIVTRSGYALVKDGSELYKTLPSPFPATAVSIKLRCDESYYMFAEEASTTVF